MRNAPDRRVRQTAHWMELLARETTDAKLVLTERYYHARAGSSSAEPNDRVSSSLGSSPVEMAALESSHWSQLLDQLNAGNDRLRQQLTAHRRWIRDTIMRGPDIEEPEELPPCSSGQVGKEGAIEWGDPTCDFPPDKAGMCQSHWWKWYRHRKAHGIDTTKDFAA